MLEKGTKQERNKKTESTCVKSKDSLTGRRANSAGRLNHSTPPNLERQPRHYWAAWYRIAYLSVSVPPCPAGSLIFQQVVHWTIPEARQWHPTHALSSIGAQEDLNLLKILPAVINTGTSQ